MKYDSILETIGDTPIVKLGALAPPHVSIYVKVEAFNPMGSVKDRLALAVIEDAERRGVLKPGQTVIEATSGNTGIGLAMVCAKKGYPLVIVMAENFSIERRRLMRFLGAKVVLTPAADKGSGMLAKAVELAETHGWFLTRQFENEANADIHQRTTAQEILRDFEGERLDYWVSTYGTGGTVKGVARTLKAKRPETKMIVTEPDNSQVLGQRRLTDRFRPHPMQGTSPDFIAKLTRGCEGSGWIDEIVPVNGGDALRLARELATSEGIFVGISAGAAVAAALKMAETAPKGSTILAMLPDTGERYLSTPLFDDVAVDMTPEEDAISKSSPSNRFDMRPAPAPAAAQAPAAPVDAEAAAFVDKLITRRAGAAVCAGMVRVLLGDAQALQGARHPLSLDRSGFGGDAEGRLGRTRAPRRRRARGRTDHPAGVHRRRADRRQRRDVRCRAQRRACRSGYARRAWRSMRTRRWITARCCRNG